MSSLVLIALLAGAAGVAVGWLLGGQRGHRSDAERAMLAERLRDRKSVV